MKDGRSDAEATYQRYFPVIRAKCRRMLFNDDDAQDVAQESFERLCRQQRTLPSPEAVLAWLYRTATRIAIDRLRRRDVEALIAMLPHGDVGDDIDECVTRRDLVRRLHATLEKDELEALILTRVDGLTHIEAALVMQLKSDRDVRRVLERAKASLARFQKEDDDDR